MGYQDPRPEGLNTDPAPPSAVETMSSTPALIEAYQNSFQADWNDPAMRTERDLFTKGWYARAAVSADGGEEERDLYYVQDTRSFIGNCPMWWGEDFRGYVTRMDEAGKYTREEAERICKRETDKMWPCHMIDPLRRPTIDFQHLPTEDERVAAIAANQAKGDAS
ncbi:hypothetical protein [Pandoraea sp. PE-S2R-1]|uniref:hypothetical protein n=1 Tax=Pandoraea sp. PE-S2R-1 TaxID=1986994 RepID=UPI000B3FAB6C|nr:hypothetical protein [Pandoraea sp. PE-S2R-1]